MNKAQLKALIKEELELVKQEYKSESASIAERLEELRLKLIEHGELNELEWKNRMHRRVALETVSKIIEIPMNSLMLHFLNEVKTSNVDCLVEYRLGHVYFYSGKEVSTD